MPNNLPVPSRVRDGAMLGGVCAGLARRWQIDPNVLRIALVVLVFFGGLGLAVYGAGLALMPKDGTTGFPIRRWLPFTRTWPDLLVVAVTLGALAVLAGLPSHGFGLGPLLVIFGVWRFGSRSQRRSVAPPEPTPFERQAEAWRDRLAEQQVPGYTSTPTQQSLQPVATWQQPYTDPADLMVQDNLAPDLVVARRSHARTWLLIAIVAGIGSVLVTVAGLIFGLPPHAFAYAAVVLAAFGVGLVASARHGRPRALLPLTVLSAAVTAALMLPGPGSIGDVSRSYSGTSVPSTLSAGLGDVTLDLSQVELAQDQTMTISVNAGDVDLTLPIRGTTVVNYHVGAGSYTGQESRDGIVLDGTETYAFSGSAKTLTLDVQLNAGDLKVRT